jgi:hypothetical protein
VEVMVNNNKHLETIQAYLHGAVDMGAVGNAITQLSAMKTPRASYWYSIPDQGLYVSAPIEGSNGTYQNYFIPCPNVKFVRLPDGPPAKANDKSSK